MPGSGYSIFNMTMRKRKQFKKLITEIRKYQAYGDYTLTDEQQLAVDKSAANKRNFYEKSSRDQPVNNGKQQVGNVKIETQNENECQEEKIEVIIMKRYEVKTKDVAIIAKDSLKNGQVLWPKR